jgi:ABC-type polysaccharide/polyol phosphate transport system ATPase subunit
VNSSDRNLSTALGASTERLKPPAASATSAGEQDPDAAAPTANPAIVASEISKKFRISSNLAYTLKERVLHPIRRPEIEILDALRDVSFEVGTGEFFGIVGRNGSGKSTLLKVIAGIYRPDGGDISVAGRLSPFIELGVGFNPELPARDNIVINCSLLGLTRAEALRRYEHIIEFAELQRFVDMKLKNYSSGMQVRLAFSTAIQVDADILLLDEVLAVGDARFQEKCFEVFRQMKRDGRTIVLVTHNVDILQRFCDRVMLIDSGEVVAIGKPQDVIDTYRKAKSTALGEERDWEAVRERGEGSAEIIDAWLENPAGERVDSSTQGETMRICAEAVFRRPATSPVFAIQLRNERNEVVFLVSTDWDEIATPEYAAGDRVRMSVEVENRFALGRYFTDLAILNEDKTIVLENPAAVVTFIVNGRRWTPAVVDLPHNLSVERIR